MSDRSEPARSRELAPIAALALLLLVFFLGLFVVRGFRLPVGPDGPVYLWWARLAGQDGLSTMERPGVPAISLTLAGTLHVPLVAATAALQCVIGTAVGLAAAMLLRAADPRDRAAWLLGGALTGFFAVHLVSGYLSNLALAATFVAAAAALTLGTRPGTAVAACLLAAGTAFHPQFSLVAIVILVVTALLSWRSSEGGDRFSDLRRIGVAVAGSAVIVGAGLLALRAGPNPLDVDTSRDAFLRRVGMSDTLKHLFRDRFVHRATRYVQWISVPLAVAGLPRLRGFVARFLAAWGLVTVAGVAFGLMTAPLPPDRFVTFGYVVPMLAGVGAARLGRALGRRRAAAATLVAALAVLMVLGAFFAWRREKPYLGVDQIAQVTAASRILERTPPGTPAFFYVETGDATITFFATQAGNAIRAAVPPDRIRDVHLLFFPTKEATEERQLLFEDAAHALDEASDRADQGTGLAPITFALSSFILPANAFRERVTVLGHQVVELQSGVWFAYADRVSPLLAPAAPLEPSSPAQIVLATFATLALFAVVGFGWARAAGFDRVAALALSPAGGLAALTLGGIALERLGVPLTGAVGPTAVSAATGCGGYFAQRFLERRAAGKAPT